MPFFQVDPRCHIQYLYWFHEDISGNRRLLKTGRNATEPYVHTIYEVYEKHHGRYLCIIGNVMGENECSAYLVVRNGGQSILRPAAASTWLPMFVLTSMVCLLHQSCQTRMWPFW